MASDSFLPPLIFPWTVIVPLIGAVMLLVAAVWRARRGSDPGEQVFQLGFASFGCFMMAVVFGFFSVIPTFVEFYVPAIFDSGWIASIALVAGLTLFWLRKQRLDIYALLEITGAISTIAVCAFQAYGSTFQRAAALLTATYFLVRGLDNADRGGLLTSFRRWLGQLNEVIQNVRAEPRFDTRRKIMSLFFIGAIISWPFIPNPNADIPPPYLASKNDLRLPVSPMHCGDTFVVCDKAAWLARAKLMRGTAADRAAAERDAERYFHEHEAAAARKRPARANTVSPGG